MLSTGSIRVAPCRSAVALPVGATSNASSSESGPMPTHERLGPDDGENLQDCPGSKPSVPSCASEKPRAWTKYEGNHVMKK